MERKEKEPFKPCVTIEQCIEFNPDRPETYTASPIMNAVLRAIAVVGTHSSKAIADYLQVPSRLLWPAVELLTGYNQYRFRKYMALNFLIRLKEQHPDWSTDQFANVLGYRSRASLYRLLGREGYNDKISNKTQPVRYAKNRKRPTE